MNKLSKEALGALFQLESCGTPLVTRLLNKICTLGYIELISNAYLACYEKGNLDELKWTALHTEISPENTEKIAINILMKLNKQKSNIFIVFS